MLHLYTKLCIQHRTEKMGEIKIPNEKEQKYEIAGHKSKLILQLLPLNAFFIIFLFAFACASQIYETFFSSDCLGNKQIYGNNIFYCFCTYDSFHCAFNFQWFNGTFFITWMRIV